MRKVYKPRPYQSLITGRILEQKRLQIWVSMGGGKTIATLTALQVLTFMESTPALVVAPLRVARSTWPDEAEKWEHLKGLRVSVVCGSERQRLAALAEPADVYCTNFEQLPWLVEHYGKKWPFRIVVVDEATRLKGFRLRGGSSRAKALARVYSLIDRFIELTGTPAANGLIDLWGQAWFIDQGKRLGKSMSAYETRFFTPVRTGDEAYMVKWVPNEGSDGRIKALLADVTLTVNAEDYFDIKEPIMNRILVELPPAARKVYDAMEDELYAELENGELEAANSRVALSKCLQIASGAVYGCGPTSADWQEIHKAKIDALKSVVEEAAGASVLVSYQYKHEVVRIMGAFKNARLLDKDPQTIRDWNAGKIPLLLAHPAACGHGLNLQDGGNILCFFSAGWNYEQHAQIIERIGPTRQAQSGHPRPVFVHSIVAKGTVDEAVYKALAQKEDVLDFLLGKIKWRAK